MKNCGNCEKGRHCFYKGIQNPCGDFQPNKTHRELTKKAKACVGKPLDFAEGRFIEQAKVMTVFSPKQEKWLTDIHARVAV
jgi:hypothetical protein